MEILDVLDENGKIIGKASIDECHEKGHWHRSCHVIITNSKGKVLLQKRSSGMKQYPGFWTSSASGHVSAGESYEAAAQRELIEEVGIKPDLKHIFDVKKFTGKDNELVRVFAGRHDGPFAASEEVEAADFFTLEESKKMLKSGSITPGSIIILKKIFEDPSVLKNGR